jgi:hypothetical protein
MSALPVWSTSILRPNGLPERIEHTTQTPSAGVTTLPVPLKSLTGTAESLTSCR